MKRIIALAITAALMTPPALLAQEQFRPFGLPLGESFSASGMLGKIDDVRPADQVPTPNPNLTHYWLEGSKVDPDLACSVLSWSEFDVQRAIALQDALSSRYGHMHPVSAAGATGGYFMEKMPAGVHSIDLIVSTKGIQVNYISDDHRCKADTSALPDPGAGL